MSRKITSPASCFNCTPKTGIIPRYFKCKLITPPCRPLLVEDRRSSDDDPETMEMVGYTGRTASGMVKQMLNLRSRSNSTVQTTEEERRPHIHNGSLTPVLGTPVHKQPSLKQSRSLTKINKLRVQSEFYTHQDEMVFSNDNVQLGSEGAYSVHTQ